MSELLELLAGSGLPPWLFWPLATGLTLWIALPRFFDLLPERRMLSRERARLELTKLHFEIEGLKKQHGLENQTSPFDRLAPREQDFALARQTATSERVPIGRWKRFLYGSLGGAAVGAFRILEGFLSAPEVASIGSVLGGVGGVAVVATAVGFLASVLRSRDPRAVPRLGAHDVSRAGRGPRSPGAARSGAASVVRQARARRDGAESGLVLGHHQAEGPGPVSLLRAVCDPRPLQPGFPICLP